MIFVTGGTGLLGSYLLYYLIESQREILVLKQKDSLIEPILAVFKELNPENAIDYFNKINWIEGSLFDLDFLENTFKKVDEVYHCAAFISFDESNSKEIFKINLEATINLLNFSIDKVAKFCYVSSIAALGKSFENDEVNEETEFKNKNDYSSYGLSKYAAEVEVFRASQEGLNTVIVNPGVILGSHHWERKSSLVFKLNQKKYSYSTSGISYLVDVEDVVKCMIQLMDKNIFNQRYVLVSNPISYTNQNDLIRTLFGKPKSIFINNFYFILIVKIALIFKPFTKKLNELNKYTAKALISQQKISNEKIKKELGFEFISTEDSLKKHTKNYIKYLKYLENETI